MESIFNMQWQSLMIPKRRQREEDEAKLLDMTKTKMMMVDSKKTCID